MLLLVKASAASSSQPASFHSHLLRDTQDLKPPPLLSLKHHTITLLPRIVPIWLVLHATRWAHGFPFSHEGKLFLYWVIHCRDSCNHLFCLHFIFRNILVFKFFQTLTTWAFDFNLILLQELLLNTHFLTLTFASRTDSFVGFAFLSSSLDPFCTLWSWSASSLNQSHLTEHPYPTARASIFVLSKATKIHASPKSILNYLFFLSSLVRTVLSYPVYWASNTISLMPRFCLMPVMFLLSSSPQPFIAMCT